MSSEPVEGSPRLYSESSILGTAILYDLSAMVGIDEQETLNRLALDRATRTLCAEAAAIVLRSEDGAFHVAGGKGMMPDKLELCLTKRWTEMFDRALELTDRRGIVLRTYNGNDTELGGVGYRAILIQPISQPSAKHGILIACRLWTDDFTDEDRRLYSILAQRCAVALDSIKLRDRLYYLSITDPLTGLYNYRHMYDQLSQAVNRGLNSDRSFLICMMDLNNFKTINDVLGHKTGDKILSQLAQFLKKRLKDNDMCFRIGGDEFIILFKDSRYENAEAYRERIQQFLQLDIVKWLRSQGIALDIAVGFACFPSDGTDVETLMRVADRRMYANKQALKAQSEVAMSGEDPN